MGDRFFRVTFICVFSCLSTIRLHFRIRAGLFHEPLYSPDEPIGFILFRSVVGVPLLLAVFAYCFVPGRCLWAYIPLPEVLRILGLLPAVWALLLLVWAHTTLGRNFSTSLSPKSAHSFVTIGPYSLIRHPMYLAYFVLFVSAFLISENWVIGSTGLAIIGMLMTVRRVKEEQLLLERFGEAYKDYRDRTGRFIPRSLKSSFSRRRK